jgi:hypothetical protein
LGYFGCFAPKITQKLATSPHPLSSYVLSKIKPKGYNICGGVMDLLRLFLDPILEKYEWHKADGFLGSPFQGLPGLGVLRTVYKRAWWPSILRIVVMNLPPFLIGFYFFRIIFHPLSRLQRNPQSGRDHSVCNPLGNRLDLWQHRFMAVDPVLAFP